MACAAPGKESRVEWDTLNNRIIFNITGNSSGKLMATKQPDGKIHICVLPDIRAVAPALAERSAAYYRLQALSVWAGGFPGWWIK